MLKDKLLAIDPGVIVELGIRLLECKGIIVIFKGEDIEVRAKLLYVSKAVLYFSTDELPNDIPKLLDTISMVLVFQTV